MLAVLAALIIASTHETQEPSIVLPEGVTCNDLFWRDRSRVNPTELSDYQKCVLGVNYGETDSGVLGDLLWVRVDGEYYSVSKRELRSAFSNEEDAKRAFNREIHKQIKIRKAQQ